MPSMMCNTVFCRMTGRLTTAGMKAPQAFRVGVEWLRHTLFTSPCERFLSAKVTPADKAAGLALTFANYTVAATANCGGGGCHVGALPHGFVGDLATSQDTAYSTGILVDLSNGTMPKGRAITPADRAIITNYLCARLNI